MQNTVSIWLHVAEALALLVLGGGIIFMAVIMRQTTRSLSKLDRALESIADNAAPALDRARAIGENVNYIVMSLRRNVEEASETVTQTNRRIEATLEAAEERVRELNAVVAVVQEEVEETLLSAGSALRGLRAGAEMLTARGDREKPGDGARRDDEPT